MKYKVWSDSESKVQIEEIEFENLKDAADCACTYAHLYDGKEYRAIFHVEDMEIGETIDTYENLLEGELHFSLKDKLKNLCK